jgi:microsomal dipeptidase-like Zn-dependent dipeptidase
MMTGAPPRCRQVTTALYVRAEARTLDGRISMIAAFYRLGIRSMLLAHNASNEFSAAPARLPD